MARAQKYSLRVGWTSSILACSLLLTACGVQVEKPVYAGPRPDVVIVLIDTLRADFVDLEPDGNTPFLASLASESVVFEDASSAAPWTLPSVASLVTGRHVLEHGVVQENRRLPRGMTTLAEHLWDAGYATRAFYRNVFAGPMCDLDRGYQYSERSPSESGGEEIAHLLMEPDGEPDERPLFLYVHNAEPHDPHDKEANKGSSISSEEREFIDWYRTTVAQYRAVTRRGFQDNFSHDERDFDAEQSELLAQLTERRDDAYRIYARAVRESDDRIRSIVDKLRERGRWDQTMFIVVSDHGEEMGEHGGWLHDQSLFQELVHIPLIIRFPGGEFGGQRVEAPVSLIDVMPTVLGAVGAEAEFSELEGRDWSEVLRTESVEDESPRVVSIRINERKRFGPWEQERGDRNIAVRFGKWKGIWSVERKRLLLFDTEADPGETTDLTDSQPERARELTEVAREAWFRLGARSQSEEGEGFDGLDEGALDNLRELGYLGEDE